MNTQHTVSWCILKYRLYVSINFWILWSDAMVFASLLLKMVHCKWTGAGVLLTALGSDQKGRWAEQMLSFHSLNLPHSSLSPCFTVTCLVFNPGVLILLPPLLSFMFYINIKITYFFSLTLEVCQLHISWFSKCLCAWISLWKQNDASLDISALPPPFWFHPS